MHIQQFVPVEKVMLHTPLISVPSLACLAALGVFTVASSGCTGAEGHVAAASAPLLVETMRVEQLQRYEVRRVFSGSVRSRRASELGFERPGLVASVHVDEGDIVTEGQLIAKLDTAQLRAARRRVAAGLREAQAGVGISTLTADRLEKLADEQYIARQSADEARFNLQAAEAKRQELRAALAQLDVDLQKSRLVAPFAGIVSMRLVDEGTVVGAGAPVIRFRESAQKEAVIGVPTSVRIPIGTEQELRIHGRSFRAPVTAHVDDVNLRTRTVAIIIELPSDVEAADGEVVDLVHRREVSDAGFWVPTTSLTEGVRGLWTMYALDSTPEGLVVRREAIEVLHAETDRAFVRGTLESGDLVITNGLHRVVPGQRVRDRRAEASSVVEAAR